MPQNIKGIIDKVNQSEVASIKSVVSGIIRVINDPKSTANDLIEVVEVDPPLMGKVLKVANSAYYSPVNKIGDLKHALVWIGLDTLKELALSQKVYDIFEGTKSINGYSRNGLWKHCVAVAKLSKMIFRKEFGEKGTNAYVAGLLHDIGIIVEDHFMSDEFKIIIGRASAEEKNLPVLEKEVFGFNHAEIGMTLTKSWGLPQELSVAIGYHHKPLLVEPSATRLTSTIYVSEILSQKCNTNYSDIAFGDDQLYTKCISTLGIDPNALNLILEDVRKELAAMHKQGLF